MEFKIDAKGIEALFPEGTEARLRLQNCVIAEIAKRAYNSASQTEIANVSNVMLRDPDFNHVGKFDSLFKAELEKLVKKNWQGIKLLDETKQLLRSEIKEYTEQLLKDQIREMVTAEVGARSDRIKDIVTRQVDMKLPTLNTARIDTLIEEKVTSRINGMYQASMKPEAGV